ncbi:hypothetical protein GCM10027059_37940 [Myceligenerans halotolerans]
MTITEPPSYKAHRTVVVALVVAELTILGLGLGGHGPLAVLGGPMAVAVDWTAGQLGAQ